MFQATNPGAFDPAEDVAWHRNGHALYTQGPVAINTEMPVKDAKLSLHGDFFHAGRVRGQKHDRNKQLSGYPSIGYPSQGEYH